MMLEGNKNILTLWITAFQNPYASAWWNLIHDHNIICVCKIQMQLYIVVCHLTWGSEVSVAWGQLNGGLLAWVIFTHSSWSLLSIIDRHPVLLACALRSPTKAVSVDHFPNMPARYHPFPWSHRAFVRPSVRHTKRGRAVTIYRQTILHSIYHTKRRLGRAVASLLLVWQRQRLIKLILREATQMLMIWISFHC